MGHVDIVRILANVGESIDHADQSGLTALMMAARAKRTKVVEQLVRDFKANIDVKTNKETFVLEVSACCTIHQAISDLM